MKVIHMADCPQNMTVETITHMIVVLRMIAEVHMVAIHLRHLIVVEDVMVVAVVEINYECR
jgi:uncharacterized protein (DUF983 family)